MKKLSLFTLLIVCIPFISFSQNFYFLRGFVYSETNEAIPLATIRVVNQNTGTTSDQNGKYEIKLLEGLNRISVSSTGYLTDIFEVLVEKDVVKNVFLKIDQKQLNEIVIKVKKKDYSYEVIRHVIDNKSNMFNQYQNFRSKTYIKSVEIVDKKPPKKKDDDEKDNPGELLDKKPVVKDTIPNLNIFECSLIQHQNAQGQLKEEKRSCKENW